MRKRYFARSDGASADQPSSKAPRAADDRELDVLGTRLRDLEERLLGRRARSSRTTSPERGSTSSPPMKSP